MGSSHSNAVHLDPTDYATEAGASGKFPDNLKEYDYIIVGGGTPFYI